MSARTEHIPRHLSLYGDTTRPAGGRVGTTSRTSKILQCTVLGGIEIFTSKPDRRYLRYRRSVLSLRDPD